MGQQKGNPTPSYQNQAYEALYPNTNARQNRDMGTKPVMIDDTTTINDYIDLTFDTDAVAAMVSASLNTTIYAVSSSINTNITAVSSSINTNITAVSSSLEARISNLEQPSKAYNTSNTSYTPSNTGTVTFSFNLGGDQRGYSVNEIVYFQKFDGSFTGIGTVTGAVNSPEASRTLSVTQNSGGSALVGNYWVISRYVI